MAQLRDANLWWSFWRQPLLDQPHAVLSTAPLEWQDSWSSDDLETNISLHRHYANTAYNVHDKQRTDFLNITCTYVMWDGKQSNHIFRLLFKHSISPCLARRIRCQADLNSFPLGKLEETTGTPRTVWMKPTQQDLKSMNFSLNKATDVAQNRLLWRLMCLHLALCTHSGACQKWTHEWHVHKLNIWDMDYIRSLQMAWWFTD